MEGEYYKKGIKDNSKMPFFMNRNGKSYLATNTWNEYEHSYDLCWNKPSPYVCYGTLGRIARTQNYTKDGPKVGGAMYDWSPNQYKCSIEAP